MKKLKVKFTYECEIEVKPEELEILKKISMTKKTLMV